MPRLVPFGPKKIIGIPLLVASQFMDDELMIIHLLNILSLLIIWYFEEDFLAYNIYCFHILIKKFIINILFLSFYNL